MQQPWDLRRQNQRLRDLQLQPGVHRDGLRAVRARQIRPGVPRYRLGVAAARRGCARGCGTGGCLESCWADPLAAHG